MARRKIDLLLLAIGISIFFTGCGSKSQSSKESMTSKEVQTQVETKVSENGDIVKVVTASDGSITEISTVEDGSTVEKTTKEDGTTIEKTTKEDGTVEIKTIDNSGSVVSVTVTETQSEGSSQAPTQAPTQAPIEAPTQAPIEAPTQAPSRYILSSAEDFLKQGWWTAKGMDTSQNVFDQLSIIGDDFSNGVYTEEQANEKIKQIKDSTQPEWWIFESYTKIIVANGKLDCSNMQSKQTMVYVLSTNVELIGDNKYTRVLYDPTKDITIIYYTTVSGTVVHN